MSLRAMLYAGAAGLAMTVMPIAGASAAVAAPEAAVVQQVSSYSMVVPMADGDADPIGSGSNTSAAQQALYADVARDISGNTYELEGGGNVQGSNILGTNGEISPAVYGRLSPDAQNRFVNDMVTSANQHTDPSRDDYVQESATQPYDRTTVTDWFRQLQTQGGMGSSLLTALMADVGPDIVGAHQVLQPFKGGINTVMGVIAVAIMMFFALSVVIDIFYITIPFFQNMMASGGGASAGAGGSSGGGGKNILGSIKMVTPAARKAVDVAENGGEPMWYYIKARAVAMLALGIALLYLVVGQLWSLVGGVIDLGSGFLGI